MRIFWTTDIHLNFLKSKEIDQFISNINSEFPDALLIGGDIGEAPTVCNYLLYLRKGLKCPVYFVLGNHDYYHGSFSEVNGNVQKIAGSSEHLFFLDDLAPIELDKKTALLGHGCWADSRFGDYANSTVMLNDYLLIKDFAGLGKEMRLKKLRELGDSAAEKIENKLVAAFRKYPQVVLLTHVPPFKESCWHKGKMSDDDYLPHFSCKAAGDAMIRVMRLRPESYLTVLCGHTHSPGRIMVLENLEVITGSSDYGRPEIQELKMQKE